MATGFLFGVNKHRFFNTEGRCNILSSQRGFNMLLQEKTFEKVGIIYKELF